MDDFRRRPVSRPLPQSGVQRPQQPLQPEVPTTPRQPIARPQFQPQPAIQDQPVASPVVPEPSAPQPITTPSGVAPSSIKAKKSRKKPIIWSIVGVIAAIILTIGGIFFWYTTQLSPVDSSNSDKKLVKVESGSTPEQIANLLKDEGVIRSSIAFLWYTRLQGVQNTLQAGSYRLSPSESTPEITEHLTSGKVDTFNIRFLPGATLADNRDILIGAGYDVQEVDIALAKTYNSPLFEGKPVDADLEGYIYGETYSFGTDTSVEAILEHVFAEFYSVVDANGLVAKYKAQGLTLYEGITLASIVQREASPAGDDMPVIAQVFYNRLAEGMPLGSDVTYQYIADKTGVARDTNLDSPYNTRRYTGLPPGPIASPGEKALLAVGSPTKGDYLYFLSGDDDITYYGRTLQEHEANIANHCQKKCQIL